MSYQQVPDGEVPPPSPAPTPASPEKEPLAKPPVHPSQINWKREKVPSRPDLIVYEYDVNLNRYKPYMASEIKLGEEFPQREISRMFDEINQNIARPPKVRRALYGKDII